jgi:hypothetical protein
LQGSNLSSESKATTLDDCESIKKIGSSYVVESDHAVVQVFSTVGGGTIDYSMGSLITPTVVSEFKFTNDSTNEGYCLGSALVPEGCYASGSGTNGTLEVYSSIAKPQLCYLRFVGIGAATGSGISALYSFRSLGSGQFDFFDFMLLGSGIDISPMGSYPFDSMPEVDEYLNQNLHVIGPGYYR